MRNLGVLVHRIQEGRIRSGYRPSGSPREHMPPDYVERCVRYPTAALLILLAMLGGALAALALFVVILVTLSRTTVPAATHKAAPPPLPVVVQSA